MERETIAGITILLCLIAAIVGPITYYLLIMAPADAQYNRNFSSHVTMAYDQATFEGMLTQINVVWQQMNKTFSGFDYATTYNTWWYPEQTYDNSLLAENDYLQAITSRLEATIVERNQILNGTKVIVIPYNQWYQQTLEGFRSELQRAGGLDWAIRGAWYLNFQPMAYWYLVYWIIGWIVLFIIGILASILGGL